MSDTVNAKMARAVLGFINLKHYHSVVDQNSPNITIKKRDIDAILVNINDVNQAKRDGVKRAICYLINQGALKHISGNYYEDDFCCELINYNMLDVILKRVENGEYDKLSS